MRPSVGWFCTAMAGAYGFAGGLICSIGPRATATFAAVSLSILFGSAAMVIRCQWREEDAEIGRGR